MLQGLLYATILPPFGGGSSAVMVLIMTIVMLTVIGAIAGFIGGAIAAILYNLVADWVGGIKLELE